MFIFLRTDRNNIHEFTALENTAVFDILLPPYDELLRSCSYYGYNINVGRKTSVYTNNNIGDEIILKKIDEPTEQLPYGVKYTGYDPTKVTTFTSKK